MKVKVTPAEAARILALREANTIKRQEMALREQEMVLQRTVIGPPGAPGKDGADGAAGTDGARGVDGVPGERGADGATGPQGPKGDKGDKGDQGDTGPKGDKGDPGADGAPGPIGPQGIKGDGFTARGTWSGSESYKAGDVVDWLGDTWVATDSGNDTPRDGAKSWKSFLRGKGGTAYQIPGVQTGVTLGAVASTSNAKGAAFDTTGALTLTPADSTNPGLVTTLAQTWDGVKTFLKRMVLTAGLDLGSPVQIPTADLRIANTSGPSIYLESTSAVSPVSTGGIFFGNASYGFSWILVGNAPTSANDIKEFRLSDGNTVHWSIRAAASGHDARQYWGAQPVTATGDGNYVFKHMLSAGTGIGNNISTLVVKGAAGTTNNTGAILDLQTNAGSTVAKIDLTGQATLNGGVKFGDGSVQTVAATASGTNTGDVTIGTANGLSLSGQALSLANVVAAGSSGAMTGSDKTKLDAITGTHTGSNTGDVTVTAPAGSSSANGATLSGQALTLTPADGSNPGLLTAGTQTIGGTKTFSGAPTFNVGLVVASLNAIVWGVGTARGGIQNGAGAYTGLCLAGQDGGAWPMPACFNHSGTATSNTDTSEDTLYSDTHISQFGNDMSQAGRGFEFHAFGTFAANGNTKTIKLKINGTDVTAGLFTGAFNGGGWSVKARFVRTSGTSANAVCVEWFTTSATPVRGGNIATTAIVTGTNDFPALVTGQGGAAGDITILAYRRDYLP